MAAFAGPMVRIRLPPPASLRTIGSAVGEPLANLTGLLVQVRPAAVFLGSSRPTILACCTVNHRTPLWSKTSVRGSRAFASGRPYSVTVPVFGSSFPINPRKLLPLTCGKPCCSRRTEANMHSTPSC